MDKDEMKMIEEMAKIANFSAFDFTQGTIQSKTIYAAMAEALYNANCRIIAEDEIVVKKSKIGMLEKTIDYLEMEKAQLNKQLEQAEQEMSREILQELKEMFGTSREFNWIGAGMGGIGVHISDRIEQFAKEKGIELED